MKDIYSVVHLVVSPIITDQSIGADSSPRDRYCKELITLAYVKFFYMESERLSNKKLMIEKANHDKLNLKAAISSLPPSALSLDFNSSKNCIDDNSSVPEAGISSKEPSSSRCQDVRSPTMTYKFACLE
jgi:hypothetical protein